MNAAHAIWILACALLSVALLIGLFAAALLVAAKLNRAPKPPEWFKCLACGVYECTDGRQQFRPPLGVAVGRCTVRYRIRECTDCKGAAVQLNRASKLPVLILIFTALPLATFADGEKSAREIQDLRSQRQLISVGGSYEMTSKTPSLNPSKEQVSGTRGGVNLIDRIAQIESGGDATAIGDDGRALGAWQLTEAAWADVNSLRRAQQLPEWPWDAAHDLGVAREYALQFIGLLEHKLTASLSRRPTEAELYAAYAHGFAGFKRRGFSLKKCAPHVRRNIKAITR